MREAAGAKHHRFAGEETFLALCRIGFNADDFAGGVFDQALHAMAGADVDTVALGGRGHGTDGDLAAVRHRFPGILR